MRWTWKEAKRRTKRAHRLIDWIDWSWGSAPAFRRKDRKTRKKFERELDRHYQALDKRGLWP
jgi:hypothetical protein